MKWGRIALLTGAVLMTASGCRAPVPQTQPPVPAAVQTPAAVSFDVADRPTPTPLPPTPTPTQEPTPTPDPYLAGVPFTQTAEGFGYAPLNEALRARITGMSYPAGGTNGSITYDDLRYLRIRYVDFEGLEHEGELIVNEQLAEEVLEIFTLLYEARYALASVRLVDDYGEPGDDSASMADNNTSAFNYRKVSGSGNLSLHSFGAAIDINPLLNPYVRKSGVVPENGAAYADRSRDFPGKIDEQDLCYRLFTQRGWDWGGHFRTSKDYQHFSKDIGYSR